MCDGSVTSHYKNVLSDHYSWIFGGWDAAIARNVSFFESKAVRPSTRGCVAVDLGCGCGFQTLPLAQLGYSIIGIDLDAKLLQELREHAATSAGPDRAPLGAGADSRLLGVIPVGAGCVRLVQGDLMRFRDHLHTEQRAPELVVCMTDTLVHLPTADAVSELLRDVHAVLEPRGRFIVTFRDMSVPVTALDRFIPVRSDDLTVFTCFVEYDEPGTVKVHDIVYYRRAVGDPWQLKKSFFRKLRLSKEWVDSELRAAGFRSVTSTVEAGFVVVVATKEE